jgi:hypothetical protein
LDPAPIALQVARFPAVAQPPVQPSKIVPVVVAPQRRDVERAKRNIGGGSDAGDRARRRSRAQRRQDQRRQPNAGEPPSYLSHREIIWGNESPFGKRRG